MDASRAALHKAAYGSAVSLSTRGSYALHTTLRTVPPSHKRPYVSLRKAARATPAPRRTPPGRAPRRSGTSARPSPFSAAGRAGDSCEAGPPFRASAASSRCQLTRLLTRGIHRPLDNRAKSL